MRRIFWPVFLALFALFIISLYFTNVLGYAAIGTRLEIRNISAGGGAGNPSPSPIAPQPETVDNTSICPQLFEVTYIRAQLVPASQTQYCIAVQKIPEASIPSFDLFAVSITHFGSYIQLTLVSSTMTKTVLLVAQEPIAVSIGSQVLHIRYQESTHDIEYSLTGWGTSDTQLRVQIVELDATDTVIAVTTIPIGNLSKHQFSNDTRKVLIQFGSDSQWVLYTRESTQSQTIDDFVPQTQATITNQDMQTVRTTLFGSVLLGFLVFHKLALRHEEQPRV